MAVAVVLMSLSYLILLRDLNAAMGVLTSMAIFFLPPLFTLWAIVGWLIRAKSRNFRLVTNLAISTTLIAAVTLYIGSSLTGANASDGMTLWYYMVGILWLSSITGALFTYLFLLRDFKPKA